MVSDVVTNEMYGHLASLVRASHKKSNRGKRGGLALLRTSARWALSHNTQVNSQFGNITTCPRDADRFFSAQIIIEARMYDPSHPEVGHGVGWAKSTPNHAPHGSRRRIRQLKDQINFNLREAITAAVDDWGAVKNRVTAMADKPRFLSRAQDVDYENNNGSNKQWTERVQGLVPVVEELSRDLGKVLKVGRINPFNPSQVVTDILINANLYHDNVRIAAAEVPSRLKKGYDGRGSLIKQVIRYQDAYGLVYARTKMRTKPTVPGVLGNEQTFRLSIPILCLDDIRRDHIRRWAEPFIELIGGAKNADNLSSGIVPTITDPEVTSMLIHEALAAHLVSGTYLKDNVNAILAKIGMVLFEIPVNVYDNPTLDDAFGSYAYDAECEPGRMTQLVKDGKLNRILLGREAAAFYGKPTTGNARMNYFDDSVDDSDLFFDDAREPVFVPEERESNTVIECSKPKAITTLHNMASREAKRLGLEYYVHLHSVHGAEVDTESGQVTGFDVIGYRVNIKNEKRTMFRGVNIHGSALNILRSFKGMSNDHQRRSGQCGGDSGVIGVTEIAPTAYSSGLSFHGIADGDFEDDESGRKIKLL